MTMGTGQGFLTTSGNGTRWKDKRWVRGKRRRGKRGREREKQRKREEKESKCVRKGRRRPEIETAKRISKRVRTVHTPGLESRTLE